MNDTDNTEKTDKADSVNNSNNHDDSRTVLSDDDQRIESEENTSDTLESTVEVSEADDESVQDLRQKVGELTEALQRERADATNIRRRHDEDIAGLKNRIKANVIRDLLPVIDNFERALKHIPADLESNDYIKGVQAVVKQFEDTLADMNVQRIVTVGEPFDPRYHEAVSMEEGEGTQEVVSDELQSGYRIDEDVIRHAMVRVRPQ